MSKYKIMILMLLSSVLLIASALLHTKPKENDGPGCTGDECHTYKQGLIELKVIEGLEVEVTLVGVNSNEPKGYELVDSDGNVVDVVQETRKNPFYLRANKEGRYTVFVGYQKPEEYDSAVVEIKTVGVNHKEISSSVYISSIYPNPAKDLIRVKYNLELHDNAKLSIYDANGSCFYGTQINNFCYCKEYMDIDISELTAGHYYVELSNGKDTFTRKLIIAK